MFFLDAMKSFHNLEDLEHTLLFRTGVGISGPRRGNNWTAKIFFLTMVLRIFRKVDI